MSDEPKPCPKCKAIPKAFKIITGIDMYYCPDFCKQNKYGNHCFSLSDWNALPRDDEKPSDELAHRPPCPVCGGRCEQACIGNTRAPYCCENRCTQSDGGIYQTKAEWLALDRSKMPTPERPHQTWTTSEPVSDCWPEGVVDYHDVVDEALALIDGDLYGDYSANAQLIADAWSAMLGIRVPVELVPAMFVTVKIIKINMLGRETDENNDEVAALGYLIHQARLIMARNNNCPDVIYDDGEKDKEDGDA